MRSKKRYRPKTIVLLRRKSFFARLAACALLAVATSPASLAKEMAAPRHETPTISSQFNLYKAAQRALLDAGYDPGPADGLWGSRSKEALAKFQADNDLVATGVVSPKTVEALGIGK